MLPTAEKVKECFDLSRAFFRDGVKALNKTYISSVNAEKAAGEKDRIFAGFVLVQMPRDRSII